MFLHCLPGAGQPVRSLGSARPGSRLVLFSSVCPLTCCLMSSPAFLPHAVRRSRCVRMHCRCRCPAHVRVTAVPLAAISPSLYLLRVCRVLTMIRYRVSSRCNVSRPGIDTLSCVSPAAVYLLILIVVVVVPSSCCSVRLTVRPDLLPVPDNSCWSIERALADCQWVDDCIPTWLNTLEGQEHGKLNPHPTGGEVF